MLVQIELEGERTRRERERKRKRERDRERETQRETERDREILKGLGSVLATFIVAPFTYINRNINLIIDLDYFFVCF